MEFIQFLLVIIIIMLLSLIISIGELNKNIIKLKFNIDNKLNTIHDAIINVHPNYKYKKVYESERYKQKF